MEKKLFYGEFSWMGYEYKLYTRSISKEKSFLNFLGQLSKKLNIGYWTIWQWFNGDRDNYRITEVKK